MAESTNGGGKDSAFGWGLSVSGEVLVPGTKRPNAPSDGLGPRQDNVQFQIAGGSGIGRYVFDLNSAPTPQDGVYNNATMELTPLEEIGAFGAYRHWWTDWVRSTVVGSFVTMNNLASQPPTEL